MSTEDSQVTDFEVRIAELSAEFDEFTQERHKEGASVYGPIKFLQPDTNLPRMLLEELADMSNYARYMYIRIRMWEEVFAHEGSTDQPDSNAGGDSDGPGIGPSAFTPVN